MGRRFLVTGGEQFGDAVKRQEGARFKCAKLLNVNIEGRKVETLLRYEANGINYPDDVPNSIFVSGTLERSILYLCTSTEVFLYRYPELVLIKKISYPFFQNLHHITPYENMIAVASTGLDMVVFLDKETFEPVYFKNALGKDPWHKYSMDVDYRKIVSLKPHESHPNYIFEINKESWVTRFNQQDAVCLDDMNKTINICVERLHDGYVTGNNVYFTSVNGCIVKANINTLDVEEVIDLNEIDNSDIPLGWCRGLFVEDNIAYVGFSRIRDTKVKENLKWVVNMVKTNKVNQTRIAVYDLKNKVKLDELEMPDKSINALYSIIPI